MELIDVPEISIVFEVKESEYITPVIRKILKTMKLGESNSSLINP